MRSILTIILTATLIIFAAVFSSRVSPVKAKPAIISGTKIAYTCFTGNPQNSQHNICVMNADGSQIMFTSANGMMIMKADGQNARLVTGGGSHPSFAPQADSDGDGVGDSCDGSFDVNTPTGSVVAVQTADASVNFSVVSQTGVTSFTPISPSQNQMPQGYTLCPTCPAYEITTSAVYTPPVTVCLQVPASMTQTDFFRLRLMHGENGAYVDRTTGRITNENGTRSVCGEVQSLSPFALAFAAPPTAATVSIGGRVADADGRAIRNARITLTATDGSQRSAGSNPFGYYRFADVTAGQTYVLTIHSKRFVFNPNTRVISVVEELTDLDWTAGNSER